MPEYGILHFQTLLQKNQWLGCFEMKKGMCYVNYLYQEKFSHTTIIMKWESQISLPNSQERAASNKTRCKIQQMQP